MPTEEFKKLILNSTSIGQVLKQFGLSNKGGNSKTVQRRARIESIDISHIKLGINSNKGRVFGQRKSNDEIFKESSSTSRGSIKAKLIKYNIIPYICEMCGLGDQWNGRGIVLQLDHKNGISNDNRISNLRFLCPNCHSQTETFSGKRKNEFISNKNKIFYERTCQFCNAGFRATNIYKKYCSKDCVSKNRLKNICVDKETLENYIKEYSNIAIAQKFGVSEAAVRNWLKKFNIFRKFKRKD